MGYSKQGQVKHPSFKKSPEPRFIEPKVPVLEIHTIPEQEAKNKDELIGSQGDENPVKAQLLGIIKVVVKPTEIKEGCIKTKNINHTDAQYGEAP
jgi:hypothetical protein